MAVLGRHDCLAACDGARDARRLLKLGALPADALLLADGGLDAVALQVHGPALEVGVADGVEEERGRVLRVDHVDAVSRRPAGRAHEGRRVLLHLDVAQAAEVAVAVPLGEAPPDEERHPVVGREGHGSLAVRAEGNRADLAGVARVDEVGYRLLRVGRRPDGHVWRPRALGVLLAGRADLAPLVPANACDVVAVALEMFLRVPCEVVDHDEGRHGVDALLLRDDVDRPLAIAVVAVDVLAL
mmetsp:Transcript_75057/g.219746  ORF Transcript_75057/g.219746 Transcript_75057/m.219746 type:complete len:242 (-) Transcript_75057:43-768(-)